MDIAKLEDMAYRALIARENKYAANVQQVLLDALNSIRAAMSQIYSKYAIEGLLTKTEMMKYNKYTTMEAQLFKLIDPAISSTLKTIKRLKPEQYSASFYHYAWAMDNAAGLRLAWGLVNTNAVMESFEITNPKNIEIAQALHNYGPQAKKFIRNALLRNLAQGKSFEQMAKDLKDAINKSYNWALRIIRTEAMNSLTRGQNDVYLKAMEKGIEGNVVWDATLDGRTRPTHQKMDGKFRDVETPDGMRFNGPGAFQAPYPHWEGLDAEERINCRCRIRFQLDGFAPSLRRARDEGVIPYMTYSDWQKEFHPDWKE